MAAVAVELDQARDALAAAAHRFAALLAGGFDASLPVPSLTWTTGDAVAHVVTEMRCFAQLASGEITPEFMWESYAPGTEGRPPSERMAALNAATIAGFDRTELGRGGELVEAAVSDVLSTTRGLPAGVRIRSVEGDLEVATFTCVILCELLIHGRDVAGAIGKLWVIPPDDARLVLAGAASLLPDYFDADEAGDVRATIDVRVRGGPRFAIWVHDGRLDVTVQPTQRVDCHISADPVVFLLVASGRQSHWRGASRGHLVAWGRRPWLAIRLPRIVRFPF